jgi:hypothetical protein
MLPSAHPPVAVRAVSAAIEKKAWFAAVAHPTAAGRDVVICSRFGCVPHNSGSGAKCFVSTPVNRWDDCRAGLQIGQFLVATIEESTFRSDVFRGKTNGQGISFAGCEFVSVNEARGRLHSPEWTPNKSQRKREIVVRK